MAKESSDQAKPKNTSQIPPGMILGPDGKPCKICTAFRNWKPAVPSTAAGSSPSQSQAPSGTSSGSTSTQAASPARPENCPPDVEQLGRATWTFLHTTAAYYPERPSSTQRANMLTLLRALPMLYPCTHCATHLGHEMLAHPPDVSSRGGLSRWLCERHNEVNVRLGKDVFDCAIEKTDERWKDGPRDGSCD